MSEYPRTAYDEVPYPRGAYPQSHPERLATIAMLLGLRPPALDHCRVLELGSARGDNLARMALALPTARFVGIEQSARQVAEGQRLIAALGLKNADLRQLSILDFQADQGRFDYIACHGVYSWVPWAVQDQILNICAHNLAANGIAYVSYNTYPGWHMRGIIRDIMCYHGRHFADAPTRISQSRALLDFLAEANSDQKNPYALLLKSEVEALKTADNAFLFHEHLEENNHPIYFYQFMERAAAKGLRYVGEADFHAMFPGNFRPKVEAVLRRLSTDIIHSEQYMDFLRNRMFRQTLLCLPPLTPNYQVRIELVQSLFISSPVRPVSAQPDIYSDVLEEFKGRGGAMLRSSEPLVKAAMLCLAEAWPGALAFNQLYNLARSRLQPAPAATDVGQDAQRLAMCLLSFYFQASFRLLELHVQPPRLTTEVTPRPCASPLARLEAETSNRLTNLRHETVVLEDFDRQLLRLLDGRRERADLHRELASVVSAGALLAQVVEQRLPQLARLALLIG